MGVRLAKVRVGWDCARLALVARICRFRVLDLIQPHPS